MNSPTTKTSSHSLSQGPTEMKSANIKGAKGHRAHPNKMDGKKSDNDNDCFMYNMAILVGCACEVTIRDGRKYDGIFSAFAADRHELLVEAAHLITGDSAADSDETPITEHYDVLVIPTDKMLSVRFKSVDTTYATRDFATDTAISGTRNMSIRDKELTPWDGPDAGSDEDLSLDADLTMTKENGWEARDMFKKNEEKYGVTTSFTHDLSGYTTQLDKTDADEFKRHEQQAAQIAQEIEKNTVSWERVGTELENGEDEEEAFSAVVRPSRNSASHSNLNNNNNNNSNSNPNPGGPSDKYIPPSRRSGNAPPPAQSMPQQQQQQQHQQQQQQNIAINNNGAPLMNNNGGNGPRKMYSQQNQNPRYGVPQNNSYHDRRNNYDNRRGPPPTQQQYAPSNNDGRRMDDGNRQQRVPNKPVDRRGGGRDDPSKLKEFSNNFRLQNSEQNQPPRRMAMNQQPPPPMNSHPPPANVNANMPPSGAEIGGRNNSSPPVVSAAGISSSNKQKEEHPVPLVTNVQQVSVDMSEKGPSATGTPNSIHNSTANNISINTPTTNETTPISGANTGDLQTPSTGDSSKTSESKKFTFNVHAKEFNPSAKSFTSRSPSTPPRPPSTPAQVSTPQMLPAQQIHSFMPIPMPIMYQPYAQTAALTPSSTSSASSGGATPRHGGGGGHRKGSGMIGVPPRSDMTPPIQMATGPPLLAPASMQQSAAPPQYYVPQLQQGPYPQVMRVPVMFPTEGGGQAQMHQQVHYLPHNGAPTPNSGHPNSNTPSNTPNPQSQTPVVSANGQGYNQGGGNGGHVGFPYGVVPVMGMGYHPHGPPHMNMIPVPYVTSHQGGPTVIPQSQ